MNVKFIKIIFAVFLGVSGLAATASAYSPTYPYLMLNYGRVTIGGDDWKSESTATHGFSFNLTGLDTEKLAITFSMNTIAFSGHYLFSGATEPVSARVSSGLNLRSDICYKILSNSAACLGVAPSAIDVSASNQSRSMGYQVLGLRLEHGFDNGVVIRAYADRYTVNEVQNGSRKRMHADVAGMGLGYSFVGVGAQ